MRKIYLIVLLSLLSNPIFAQLQTTNLRCEYHQNPIGIDILQPRLSWQIVSDKNNVMQTAYEIRTAHSIAGLSRKSKQLWNSGKVKSHKSVNVVYRGPALESVQRIYWQVRTWRSTGDASEWSEPAFWET
ncbi:MAG TPA: hypothetical protein VJ951_10905, partial [Bacteroidales bacterium]|nr:hypothetical protein [Bacteroidales bacterium]